MHVVYIQQVDEIIDSVEDVIGKISPTIHEKYEDKKKKCD